MGFKKTFLISTLLTSTFLFTACGDSSEATMNQKYKDLIANRFESAIYANAKNPEDYRYISSFNVLGAEASVEYVDIYGVVKTNSGKTAYTTMTFENKEGENISFSMEKLKQIVSEFALVSIKIKEVPNVEKINKTFKDLTTTEKTEYYKDQVVVFDITAPKIDEEKGVAVFKTKSYVRSFEVPENITSYTPDSSTKYDNFVVTNEIFVQISPTELNTFKNSPEMVYSKFITAVERNQTHIYSVNKTSVEPADQAQNFQNLQNLNTELVQ